MWSLILLLLGSSLSLGQNELIKKPPSMTSSFQQEYAVADKGKVEFIVSCQASGSLPITYTWQVDGREINNHMYRNLYPNGTLFISVSNDTFSPYGVYQCFATNSLGSAMSTKFTLMKPRLTVFERQKRQEKAVTEYNYGVIECDRPPICKPDWACSTNWKMGSGPTDTVNIGDRIAIGKDGSLHFLYLLRTDQLDSGEAYACATRNNVMTFTADGSPTALSITQVENKPFHSLKGRNSFGATGTIGKSATLECIFSGYPLPYAIKWYRSDTEVVPGNDGKYVLENSQRQLKINDLISEDESEYSCIGFQASTNDIIKRTMKVYLNVTGPPQPLPNQMQNVVKPVGSDIKFSCNTTSLHNELPPVGPIWYFNGKEIPNADIMGFEINFESDGVVLVIKNIQKRYTGSFQCMSYNSEGTFMRDAILVIIDPITIDLSPPATMEILPETVQYLAVSATTDPKFTLKYSWSFINSNGDSFYNTNSGTNFPEQLKLSADRQNLTLDGSKLSNGDIYTIVGSYAVRVFHEYDEVIYTTEVTTDDNIKAAPVETSSAGGFNPIIIAIILGVIVLFIVIFLIVCLLYRNRGGTYPLDKKELAAGHDPEKELADSGFHDLSRADGFDDVKPMNDRMSLNDSDKDYDSDDDLDQEYGMDFDTSKFNEDGSFIGQYTDSKRHPTNQSVV